VTIAVDGSAADDGGSGDGGDGGDGGDNALARVAALVRAVPDFPEPGVLFRDITPVLADGEAFTAVAVALAALVGDADLVIGVEARGFLLGAAAALAAGSGLVPVRKAGKLPRVAASRSYALEYGTATLELPADTVAPGSRVLVVDDVLATGGTAAAACDLVTAVGAEVVGFAAMIELVALGGRARLKALPVHALLSY
jgi:adenine phosphoribosyltransferase